MENKRSNALHHSMSRRKHQTLAPVGIAVFLMALVGLITLVFLSIQLTGRLLDNTKEKQKLEHFILPVIMQDPLTFDSPQTADPRMVLEASVWSTLLSKGRDQLPFDDNGLVLLPVTDVEVQAARLFGSGVTLQHQSFDNYEVSYAYDAENKTYSIPIASQMAVYTPQILKITHKGDIYTLEVAYIPPGNLWQTDADGNTYTPEPDKIMLMELRKIKGGYNILSLKDAPGAISPVDPNLPQAITPQVSDPMGLDPALDESSATSEPPADNASADESSADESPADESSASLQESASSAA